MAPSMIRVVQGADGLRSVMEDMMRTLKKHDVFYRYSSRNGERNIEQYTPKTYRAFRDAMQLQQYVITNARLKKSAYPSRMDCVSKHVPASEDVFEYNISQIIYGDTVACIDFTAEHAVIMKNAALAQFHKRIFLLLFHRLA